ncbi:hypothetical protein NQ318_020668 [Aromia moschata]|uniref:Uncharacterized protein n=1 Tax=Aromia moschata TaxID=1265417 RepID=A0AAV8XYS8_9CUCU|nr:hypothetical protein NQ318_020668 [Aromia moschata]
MADDVPVNSEKNGQKLEENKAEEENASSKKMTVHVKTPKEKESFQVDEDCSVKDFKELIRKNSQENQTNCVSFSQGKL